MALNETEQLSSSLLGSGGPSEPLTEQPGDTQVAMSRVPTKLGREFIENWQTLGAAKEKAVPLQDIKNKKERRRVLNRMKREGQELSTEETEELRGINSDLRKAKKEAGDDSLDPAEVEPAVAPDASPVIEDASPVSPEPAPRVDTPKQFVIDDPYKNYIKVDDADVDGVMKAPGNRDELLAGGLSDFNSGKLPDEAGIQERMESISQKYAGNINEAKRGEITREATRQMANLLGQRPSKLRDAILNRQQGQTIEVEGQGLAETMLAARDLLVSEMRKLDGLAETAKTGSEQDLLAFRYQMELVANLQQNIKGSQTEIARALGAFNIPAQVFEVGADPGLAQQLSMQARTRDFSKMLDEYGGPENVRKMAELYSKKVPPHKKAAFVRGSLGKKVFNAMYEVWQHALLTNPITQTKNIIGGLLGTFVIPNIEGLAAVGIGQIRRLAGSTDEVFTMGDMQARLFGQMMSLREATVGSANAFVNMGSNELTGFKIDRAREGRHPAFSGEAFGQTGALGTTIDWFGHIMTGGRISFRTLEAGDVFFKVAGHRSTLYEEAFRRGRAQGLEGEELSDFIAEAVTNPPPDMMEKAQAAAQYQTLQTDMDSVGKALQTLQRVPMVRYAVPFLKTPYNASKYSFLDRTPLGLAWGETNNMLKAGGAARDEAIARISVGTSVGVTMFGLAATGDITGGGPADSNMRRILRESGWQPYSIKVGGEYFSYQGMEPLSSIIGAWADASEIMVNTAGMPLSDQDADVDFNDVVGAALGATLYNVSNKTFMEGFSNLVALTQDPRRYGGKFFESLGTSLVPRVAAYVERLDDPLIRDAGNFIERVKGQVPGLSKDLKPLVSLRGEDVHAGNWNPQTKSYDLAYGPDVISPIYRKKYRDDPVVNAAKILGTISLTPAPAVISVPNLDEPIGLTDEGRYWFQKRSHSLGWELMTNYVQDPSIKKLLERAKDPKFKTLREKLQLNLQKIWLGARQAAQQELLEHPKFGRGLNRYIEFMTSKQTENLEQEVRGIEE